MRKLFTSANAVSQIPLLSKWQFVPLAATLYASGASGMLSAKLSSAKAGTETSTMFEVRSNALPQRPKLAAMAVFRTVLLNALSSSPKGVRKL